MLSKEEFNKLSIGNQVCYMNDYLEQWGSLREASHQLGINKSTIQSRFQKAGYNLQEI